MGYATEKYGFLVLKKRKKKNFSNKTPRARAGFVGKNENKEK
jgi:hypothetical protein